MIELGLTLKNKLSIKITQKKIKSGLYVVT